MKKYTSPKIKAIQLDPEQAVLEVCAVAGVYLDIQVPPSCGHSSGIIGPRCVETPKGGPGGSTSMKIPTQGGDATQSAAPS